MRRVRRVLARTPDVFQRAVARHVHQSAHDQPSGTRISSPDRRATHVFWRVESKTNLSQCVRLTAFVARASFQIISLVATGRHPSAISLELVERFHRVPSGGKRSAAGTRRDRLARSMAPGIRPHVESIDSRKSTGDRSARDAERCGMESRAGSADRSSMARPPTRRRVPPTRRWRGHPHHSTDARAWDHSTDAALSQRDGRRTQERTGGELEQQRPTASTRIRSLKSSTATRSLVGLPRRHPFVTQRLGDARSLVAGARNQHYLQLWRPAA